MTHLVGWPARVYGRKCGWMCGRKAVQGQCQAHGGALESRRGGTRYRKQTPSGMDGMLERRVGMRLIGALTQQ